MREHVVSRDMKSCSFVSERSQANNVRYAVASTPQLIDQYYQLLEEIGQNYISKNFKVTAQEHLLNNLYGQVIIAIDKNDEVVGGARIIVSSRDNRCDLPLESPSFKLRDRFPDMQLDDKTYAEWGRFVVCPGNKNKKSISENIARSCVSYAISNSVSYLFGAPILCMKKRYEEIFSNMGLDFKKILHADEMPRCSTSPDIDFYLAVTDLSKVCNAKNDLLENSLHEVI
jgi:hypothetical protein